MKDECRLYWYLIPAYALGALDPSEAQSLEAHLRTCLDCQASLREYREVSDGLLLALPPQSPPPRVRARLIASLEAGKAASASTKRRRWPIWQLGAGVAVAALLILSVAMLAQLISMQRQQAALVEQLQNNQVAVALLAYPEAHSYALEGIPQATGVLVMNSEFKAALFYAWGLGPADSAHTYQIWLIQADGHPISAGMFRPEPGQAFFSTVLRPAQPFSDLTGLVVTLEPAGGSAVPTGSRVLGTDFRPPPKP